MSKTNDYSMLSASLQNISVVFLDKVSDGAENVIFMASRKTPDGTKGITIHEVAIVSDTPTTESNPLKHWSFGLRNAKTGQSLLSDPRNTSMEEISANEPWMIVPDMNNVSIAGGSVICLDMDMTGEPADLGDSSILAVVFWSYTN